MNAMNEEEFNLFVATIDLTTFAGAYFESNGIITGTFAEGSRP